jgi:hypothetical protein
MSGYTFLVGANRTLEFDWILLPRPIPFGERGHVLQFFPTKIIDEPQVIEVDSSVGRLSFALKNAICRADDQAPVTDGSGRPLRYSFGVMAMGGLTAAEAQAEVERVQTEVIETLRKFLCAEKWVPVRTDKGKSAVLGSGRRRWLFV